MKRSSWILSACVALVASTANAQFDLQITEIWPGNEPGENLTNDWFEVTNVGDAPFTENVDGALFFDDDSQGQSDPGVFDTERTDLISGYGTIAPGETAIFIDADDAAEFIAVWGPNQALPTIGTYSGSGLSQGGDAVTLFLTANAATFPTSLLDIEDFETYPDAELFGGQSYDVTLDAFSTVGNANGAFVSNIANDVGQFGVASIGPALPEPTTAVLSALAAIGFVARRRS